MIQVIKVADKVPFEPGKKVFSTKIDSLTPNTTYYYTCYTKNHSKREEDWQSFTTSDVPCTYSQDNYYSYAGRWHTANVQITSPICCDSGNIGFRFGIWPNIFNVNFNEINGEYPKTGQYFGVNYGFDISDNHRELDKSTNQVLIGGDGSLSDSTPQTSIFVVNDGQKITLIFCNTMFRDGYRLNGKVSVDIP